MSCDCNKHDVRAVVRPRLLRSLWLRVIDTVKNLIIMVVIWNRRLFICICGCTIFLVAMFSKLPTNVIIPVHVINTPEFKILAKKSFVYLIQTESCLSKYLASPEVLGDPSSCDCDVLVLNYKERCSNISLPHVEYVFNSSTTWTTGRNLLYDLAMKRDETYHYYIFMDDDIELYIMEEELENMNPWRAFESSLKSVEPAVGVLSDINHLQSLYQQREEYNCTLNGTHEYIPKVYFDPAFNAFHYKVIQHILPYSARFDNITWWYSHFDIDIKCELMFRGQVVQHTNIMILNTKHREYKRQDIDSNLIIEMVNDVINIMPKQYHNTILVQEWKIYGLEHEGISSTLCLLPPKPHAPIVPYGHFNDELHVYKNNY